MPVTSVAPLFLIEIRLISANSTPGGTGRRRRMLTAGTTFMTSSFWLSQTSRNPPESRFAWKLYNGPQPLSNRP